MRYRRRFRDEFIVHFDGDMIYYKDKVLNIWGTTGIDVDHNKIQLRDDILVREYRKDKPYTFDKLLFIWDAIHPQLVSIAKKKMLVHRRTS